MHADFRHTKIFGIGFHIRIFRKGIVFDVIFQSRGPVTANQLSVLSCIIQPQPSLLGGQHRYVEVIFIVNLDACEN